MQNVGNHGLTCPEPDDYAAVALYMQCLAESIDSNLQQQLDGLESLLTRPTIIVTNSADVLIPAPGTRNDVFDTVLFNNSTFMSLEIGAQLAIGGTGNVISIGSPAGAAVTVPYLKGVYSIGAGQRMLADFLGIGEPGERQICSVEAIDTSTVDYLFNFETNFDRADDITRTTDAGTLIDAQNVIFSATFLGTSGIQVIHTATTFNPTNDMDVIAGALMWVTYDGPIDAVEVA